MNGSDVNDIKGYYIITLQNLYGKVLKRIIAKKVADLENRGKRPDILDAYRPGQGMTANVSIVAFNIYKVFQTQNHCGCNELGYSQVAARTESEAFMEMSPMQRYWFLIKYQSSRFTISVYYVQNNLLVVRQQIIFSGFLQWYELKAMTNY